MEEWTLALKCNNTNRNEKSRIREGKDRKSSSFSD